MQGRRQHWPFLAISFLLGSGSPLAGQAVMAGMVREDSSGRPLAGVEVLLEGTKHKTISGTTGRYVLGDLPAGTRVVLFRSVGYRPVRLRLNLVKGDTLRADAEMISERAQRLAPVEVAGAVKQPRGAGLEGFEERRRLGFGTFIDSTQLRRGDGRRLSEVLRSNTGLRMVPYTEGNTTLSSNMGHIGQAPTEIRAASGETRKGADGELCWTTVILDGIAIYRSGSSMRPPDFSREFSIASLQAVEYYRGGSEAPQEYAGRDADCGVLMLWTRRK